MTSINEILNRDHRTTVSLTKKVKDRFCNSSLLSDQKYPAMFSSCDYCQTDKVSHLHANRHRNIMKLFRYHLIFALSIYIMSSKQTDASPVPVITSPGIDEVDKVNFLNLQCHISSEKAVPSPSLSDAALRERLKAVLLSCHSALHQTKTLTDNYIKQFWGHEVTVSGHHETWEHKSIPWLFPENKPLPKKFRGEIHEHHMNELLKTDWTREKIFEYLGKIYQRFQRIGVGVQIVNKWNELASMEGTRLLNVDQVNISTRLFKNATDGIHDVLCEIEGIFSDMSINPRTDLDITPFVMDKFIKLNHWLVYREYENLMDYSHKLLKVITDEKKLK